MKNFEVCIPILNKEYEDSLITALVHQGYQVFKSGDDIVTTIMSGIEVREIEFPINEDFDDEELRDELVESFLKNAKGEKH